MKQLQKVKRAFFLYGRLRFEFDMINEDIVEELNPKIIDDLEIRARTLQSRMDIVYQYVDGL